MNELLFYLEKTMPRKPKHPCAWPGCPELVEAGERYCPEHAKQAAKDYERYKRDPNTSKRYGSAWKKIRKRYITLHPLCEECLMEGRSTLATEVHHKVPLAAGGTNDEKNLESVCKACHSRIHLKNKR